MGAIVIQNSVQNTKATPQIITDLISNRPVTAANGSIFIATDEQNIYQYYISLNDWQLIGTGNTNTGVFVKKWQTWENVFQVKVNDDASLTIDMANGYLQMLYNILTPSATNNIFFNAAAPGLQINSQTRAITFDLSGLNVLNYQQGKYSGVTDTQVFINDDTYNCRIESNIITLITVDNSKEILIDLLNYRIRMIDNTNNTETIVDGNQISIINYNTGKSAYLTNGIRSYVNNQFLTVTGTPTCTFEFLQAASTPPTNPALIIGWVDVVVNNTLYKMPLYQ